MTGPARARVHSGWDAEAFERAFPSDREDGLRPRPAATAALAELGTLGRAWDAGAGVTADLPFGALRELAAAAEALVGVADAVVLREPVAPSAPAPAHAAVVLAEILPVLVVLSPRDRNRVALEGEVAALADAGAAVVVSDGRAAPGGVHDIGEAELVALAHRAGAVVAVVAEPRREGEARRVRHLARSGAHACLTVPAAAGARAGFAREVADERGPRVVFGVARDQTPALDTAALPGFAGFHLWSGDGGDVAEIAAAAARAREVVS